MIVSRNKIWPIYLFVFFFVLPSQSKGQTVRVGLEPFAPLIYEDGTGMTINMLRAIEQVSDLQFEIRMMPYSRAKLELKQGKKDLIGHTPRSAEEQLFYEYAQELSWGIDTPVDLFSIDKQLLEDDRFRSIAPIGTPRGNEGFFAERYNIPIQNMYGQGNLTNLLQMLEKGRIKLFMFERASTMTELNKLGIMNVYYRNIGMLPASLAVRNDDSGNRLRDKLESLIKRIDTDKIYGPYEPYLNLPSSGPVPTKMFVPDTGY